jgi:hypothetical protein
MSHLSAERIAALADEPPTGAELAHLTSCSVCTRERATHAALAALAHAEPAIDMPVTTWERLAPALRREGLITTPRHGVRRVNGWVRAAAAVVLVTGGMVAGRMSAGARPIPSLASSDPGSAAPAATRFASVEEAETARRQAEEVSRAAIDYLTTNDPALQAESPRALRARALAFEAMRSARDMAPDDPVVTSYVEDATAHYETTMRQLNSVTPVSLRLHVY